MKKLMIAAAAAAMIGGAYADVCADEGDYTTSCLVYDLQIKVKTLGPKYGVCREKGTRCTDGGCADIYYLDTANNTYKGYMWFCEDYCWTDATDAYLVLWDAKTKAPIVPIGKAKDTERKVTKYYYNQGGLDFEFLGRYGKNLKKAAASWEIDAGAIMGHGAGVNGSLIYNKEDGSAMLKSISGNFAGSVVPSMTVKKLCEDGEEMDIMFANLCDCAETLCDATETADEVPASGTWSLKYNKKLSLGSKAMFQIVPKYAIWDEDKYPGLF
jgi:hypothetical protein